MAHLLLNTNIAFRGFEALTIYGGDTDQETVIACQDGNFAGFTFSNITRLTLRSLTVTHCGVFYELKEPWPMYSSAVMILYGKYVILEDLIIVNSTGIGLTILDHQGGLVRIQSSKFVGNKVPNDPIYTDIYAGGGIYVNFSQDP